MRDLLYQIWRGMIRRCFDPRDAAFAYYGARGIAVCPRWVDSFADFQHDMGPRPSQKYSVGRIDNDGNYEPGNCRWETAEQQWSNRRPGGSVSRNGKLLRAPEDCGKPTVCSELRCRSRIYRSMSSVPIRDTVGRPGTLWRFSDDDRSPALLPSVALCPRHASPAHESFTVDGAVAREAANAERLRAAERRAERLAAIDAALARETHEIYLKWKARQDAKKDKQNRRAS